MPVLSVSDSTREIIRRHVNPDPPVECVRIVAAKIRERDFDWEFGSCVCTVGAWACAWADGQFVDPAVFGQGETAGSRNDLYSAVCELQEAISGQPPTFSGPITDAIIGKVIAELLERLLQSDLPAWLAEIIKGLLS